MNQLTRILIGIVLLAGFTVGLLPATPAYAATQCSSGWEHLKKPDGSTDDRVCCPSGKSTDARTCFYGKYLNPIIRVLSVLAGLAAVAGIVIGGIQYASSGGDPQKSAAGKGKVVKAIYGLIAFMFLYSALQFLSPGGLSSSPTPEYSKGGSTANQCSKTFLGLKPWFAYLPDEAFETSPTAGRTCNIDNFSLFGNDGTGTGSHLFPVILAIVDDLVRVAGLVAVGFVISGAIRLVTSQGEPDKTKQGRDTILNALIGLVIAIIAAAVVSYIGNRLT